MHLYSNTTGETSSLEALILSCVEPVERMAYKYCSNLSNHEDFVSVGMLKVCEVAASVYAQAYITDPVAYLCGAAQHAMLKEYHRLYRLSVVSLDAPLSPDGSDGFCLYDVVPDRSPSSFVSDSSECERALHAALSRLTVRQRAAVRLRAGLSGYGTHSLGETARALCSSAYAVKKADYRGRRNLARDVRLVEVLGVEVQA
jgi:RNA polymerase sigma factor (sigma-70 family)